MELPPVTLELPEDSVSIVKHEQIRRQSDGSFLFTDDSTVYHFNADGSLKLAFGKAGDGPGEFRSVGAVLYYNREYWTIDSLRLTTTRLDVNGKEVERLPLYFRDLIHCDNKVWVLDYSQVQFLKGNQPEVIRRFFPENNGEASAPFHRISHEIVRQKYNFKKHFLASRDNRLYVLNQLEPVIAEYDTETLLHIRDIPFSVPRYTPVIGEIPSPQLGQAKLRRWWFSWSRFCGLARLSTGFIVAYDQPRKGSESPPLALSFVGEKRKGKKPLLMENSFFAGGEGSELYVLQVQDSDDKGGETYTLRTFRYP